MNLSCSHDALDGQASPSSANVAGKLAVLTASSLIERQRSS
ncbi:hypothetical protein [Pinirhizobacter sp.]|jgi:hypothetical protein